MYSSDIGETDSSEDEEAAVRENVDSGGDS